MAHKIKVKFSDLAKMIDHSLLHPTMTDIDIEQGCLLAKQYNVATVCVKPYAITQCMQILGDTDVKICAVIGFPHGNSTTTIKMQEALEAVKAGAQEIDMVVNIGKVLSGDWEYVSYEIRMINEIVVGNGGIVKVIFENDFLGEKEIRKLAEICRDLGVAFVKTSTGYGFVKDGASGMYSYKGATIKDLRIMKSVVGDKVQVKAAGGVRTLDDLIRVRSVGVTRVGATATEAILEEAKKRGIGEEAVEVDVKADPEEASGGY